VGEYFLLSVSNKDNLELCLKYALAGFTNSINGFWTYIDIEVGDYVSFLYGARVRNLYKVIKKEAFKNAEKLPPWQPVTFKMSGKTYYFPFRIFLKQERTFNEPMVRPEFSYVAENLLLRGGYRKTHFQADTITFYNVSEMGIPFVGQTNSIEIEEETYEPKIVFKREDQNIPEKFYFHELILQSLVRKKIKTSVLQKILNYFAIPYSVEDFEVLGEKALSEGFVDIFIKLKHPKGTNKYIAVEVKKGRAQKKDILQLYKYICEIGNETQGGILVAKEFSQSLLKEIKIHYPFIIPVRYKFNDINHSLSYTYAELLDLLQLEVLW
jgi:hypothetical protein